jgi:hypothetical protein
MASNINYIDIDETFPVPGIDNSTQGFRDNFALIKTDFSAAKQEIESLQNTLANLGNIKSSIEVAYALSATDSLAIYNINLASYQILTLTSSTTLSIINATTAADKIESIRLRVVVSNTNYTLTWPNSVSLDIDNIPNTLGQVTRFARPGIYDFILSTLNNGTTWRIIDQSRGREYHDGNIIIIDQQNGVSANAVTITTTNAAGNVWGTITANSIITNQLTVVSGSTVIYTNGVYTGSVTANNVVANLGLYGQLRTSAQPNITSLGNLSSLTVTGNTTLNAVADICATFVLGATLANVAANGTVDCNSTTVPQYIVNPSTTIAAATILFPSSPPQGRRIGFSFSNTITALTMTTSTAGHSILGPLTTANVNSPVGYIFYSNVWYRAV